MLLEIIFLFIFSYFSNNEPEYTFEKCYQVIGSDEKKFKIFFNSIMPIVPKFIYVEYSVFNQSSISTFILIRRFDAKLIDGFCGDSKIIFPNMMTVKNQKHRMVFVIYHGFMGYEIDRIVLDVEYGFPNQVETIKGLEEIIKIPVEFSKSTTNLPLTTESDHSYYQILPKLKNNEEYCIKSISIKNIFTLKIDGEQLTQNGAYDHYILKITAHTEGGIEVSKNFLVKTFVCNKDTLITPLQLFTDYSTSKIIFELYDDLFRHYLKAIYKSKYHHYYLDEQYSNFALDLLNILQEDVEYAVIKESPILLYQSNKTRLWCKEINDISYIDLWKVGETIVDMKSFIGDNDLIDRKIMKIKTASDSEMEQCIQQYEK